MERSIAFEVTINATGGLGIHRRTMDDFTSIELLGIIDLIKLTVIKQMETTTEKPVKNVKKKKSTNKR